MPELPEVETIRLTLQPRLAGLKFTGVHVFLPKVIKAPEPDRFTEIIPGKKIIRLTRRGKYLLLSLTGGYTLVIHLRMTGRLIYREKDEPPPQYTHVIFLFDNGSQLHFADMRQFGCLLLVPDTSLDDLAGLKNLGIEPLDPSFTREFLKKELRHCRAKIKSLLLDQTFIAGLGNIYTDEALHRAGINPERPANSLAQREITCLHHAIQEVLREGIEYRGTTVKDFVSGNGRAGSYQELLRVYSRESKPCPRCGQKIIRKKIGGRSSYYCPACQK